MPTTEAAIWAEWKKITCFIESSRIAFSREAVICSSFETLDPNAAHVIATQGPSTFRSTLKEHLQTLKDESILFSVGLLASYAMAESFARLKLSVADDAELLGGMEAWGTSLLGRTKHDWSDVLGGLPGLIEVAVSRNCVAHGSPRISQKAVSRFSNLGLRSPWAVGDAIQMDYLSLEGYRARLKSLMRFGDKTRGRPKKAISPSSPRA
jgi:hypothetical protein